MQKADCETVYQSGDASCKRSSAYDIQGVGAVVCRHYFVLALFYLLHGERYGYTLGALLWLMQQASARGVTIEKGRLFSFFHQQNGHAL